MAIYFFIIKFNYLLIYYINYCRGLFPCGDNMVCIIDDREDVWDYALNLIHVKPYHFFQHTGDINAPPNLQKNVDISSQQDNRVDFTHLVQGEFFFF